MAQARTKRKGKNPSITSVRTLHSANKYLLLAECEVRTASYGPSFFLPFMAQSAKRAGHENKEGKNEDP